MEMLGVFGCIKHVCPIVLGNTQALPTSSGFPQAKIGAPSQVPLWKVGHLQALREMAWHRIVSLLKNGDAMYIYLVGGGLEHVFPYIGNSHPNWLSYFSEGVKPPR